MSNNLEIKERKDTPYVKMNADEGICVISGQSFPPDVSKFYEPLIGWLEDIKYVEINDLSFTFKLDYYNTASSKLMLDMLYKLEEIAEKGTNIIVFWYYPEDDEDMLEAGEEFERLVDIEFRLIPYEKKYE